MNAADVMTRQVITVTPETSIEEAARLMLDRRISGLPVLDAHGAVIGIVTEGDLLRRAETGTERRRPRLLALFASPGRLARDYVLAHGRRVGDVMTEGIIAVGPGTPLDTVASTMEMRAVKRLPVIDGGRLVGIISRANLVAALARRLAETAAPSAPDREIRNRLLAEIDRHSWAPRASIRVTVRDGVVELSGTVLDGREREALRVAAENLPGVKAVHDRLVWIDPVSGAVVEEGR